MIEKLEKQIEELLKKQKNTKFGTQIYFKREKKINLLLEKLNKLT